MDPFTQRMMERARLRREKLDNEMAAVGQSDVKRRRMPLLENNPMDTTTLVSSSAVTPTKDIPKMASPKASPQKATPTEHAEEEKESNDENAQPQPSTLHSKLNRLGKLYAGPENLESLSSPVHKRTETLSRYEPKAAPNKVTSSARTARLAALARSIEEWEDDLTNIMPTPKKEDAQAVLKSPVKAGPSVRPISSPAKPTTPVKLPTRALVSSPARSPAQTFVSSPAKSPAPPPLPQTSAASPRGVQMGSRALQAKSPVRVTSFVRKATTKTIVWDQSVLASLEAQGFVASKRRSRLVYDFEGRYSSLQEERERRPTPTLEVDEEDEEGYSEPASPCTGSVSSPGWVYRAGSPVKPRMGLQSPAKKLQATAQPTTPSPVRPAMVASPVKLAVSPAKSPLKKSPSKLANKNMSPGSVLHRAAMFESAVANCSSPTVDPASLPLIQRMALFEKNKSQGPLIPKVAFSTPLPAKLITQSSAQEKPKFAEAPKLKPADVPKAKFMDMPRPKPAELCNIDTAPPKGLSSVAASAATKVLAQKAMFEQGAQETPKHTPTVAASVSERQQELEALRSRYDKQKNIANKPHQERVQMDNLRERWARETQQPEKLETPPPPPPMPAATTPSPVKKAEPSSAKQYPGLNKVREIRLSPPKAGRMYPCLSDIEATESEMDPESSSSTSHNDSASDVSETSFGDEILQAAGLNRDKTPAKRTANEMTASECAVLNEIDEFLDEALGSDEESYPGPTPPKKSKEPEVDNAVFRTPAVRELKPVAQSTPAESQQPLMHTVSFYRKQQAKGSRLATPVKQIIRHPDSDSDSEESSPEREQRAVQRKIQSLQEEVSKQQTVISQASQALNLCRSVAEFSNSQEQVEAERLLLVATHKRQALLHEMQRLKVVGTLQPEHTESGSLTISNLTLPLKHEFLSKSRRGCDDDTEQYVVCLVRCQEHLLASPMLPTSIVPPNQDVLRFPGSLTLENLGSDFAITLEVYTLQARRETMSHEEKYHIKKDTNKMRLTPKKSKHENLLVMPVVQSPAGPGAVRSSSFTLAGFTVFSLREIGRSHFTLNKVPYTSPLEGHVDMKLSCQLKLDTEQRGFLTMFDDISGYGAWHRRWCVLNGSRLSYWKYPDDEKKKTPIGFLDLRNSCTKEVGSVSRDVCARPNTFLLETRRAPHPDDEESLVVIPGEQYTILRHLLSADTRDERLQWCIELNRALSSMRAWRSSTSSNKASTATSI